MVAAQEGKRIIREMILQLSLPVAWNGRSRHAEQRNEWKREYVDETCKK
jgi:hypothetical protein